MHPLHSVTLAAILLSFSAVAQDRLPLVPAYDAELRTMFERPDGTPISEQQKLALAAFVERHADSDLGDYGYVAALNHFLRRDYPAAIAASDTFFERFDNVPIAEHATMLGRISIMAMMQTPGATDRARHAARAARLYSDSATFMRALPRAFEGLDAAAKSEIRLAVARGVLASARSPADQESMLTTLFAAAGPAPAAADAIVPALALRTGAGGGSEAAKLAAAAREKLSGEAAPKLTIDTVIGSEAELALDGLLGKVVVLDFTATWCGPCRKIIPTMIAMQSAHPTELQVIGVTRLYTYGSAFSADGSTERRSDLDRDAEVELNRAFHAHFELNYPVAIVDEPTMRDAYGVSGIPTVFVIGKDGKVVGHAVGASDTSHAKVAELVERALQAN